MKKILIVMLILLAFFALAACSARDDTIEIGGDTIYRTQSINKNTILSDLLPLSGIIGEPQSVLLEFADGTARLLPFAEAVVLSVAKDRRITNDGYGDCPALRAITVISDAEVYAFIQGKDTNNISNGEAALIFYQTESIGYYTNRAVSVPVFTFTEYQSGAIYTVDGDILDFGGELTYDKGQLKYSVNGSVPVPIVAAVDCGGTVLDIYNTLRNGIGVTKQLVILVDGLGFYQVAAYANELNSLKMPSKVLATTVPSISNVALAAIITGKSPLSNGVTTRENHQLLVEDIFDYALSKSRTVAYLEGDSVLVVTKANQKLHVAAAGKDVDRLIFESAAEEVAKDTQFIFVHFHTLDDINHEFSPYSEQAKARLLLLDQYITELVNAFVGTVTVISDHGHVPTAEGGGMHGVLQSEDIYVPIYKFA